MSSVEVRILGPVEALKDGHVVELGPPKERALLAHLALGSGGVASVEAIVDALWRAPPKTARKIVRMYAARLATLLGDAVVRTGSGFRLAAAIDLLRFEELIRQAREAGEPETRSRLYAQALEVWCGPALADLGDEPFVPAERVRLDEARAVALTRRIDAELECGHHVEVLPELEALVARQPLDERVRAQLMLALYRSGAQADALATYREARATLRDELGIEPGPVLKRLERAILRQDPALDVPRARAPVDARLPAPGTPLLGRERELDRACALLRRADVHLLTLSGRGGIGKTRLALEIAHRLAADFRDGVFVVELAALSDWELVLPAVAQRVGVVARRNESVNDALARHLHTRSVLLVLDNFEQLLEAGPSLAGLLAAAPNLKLLVTSAAALRVAPEHELSLPPLELPAAGAENDVDALATVPAVAMFVDRTQAVRDDFELSSANAGAVAELCRRPAARSVAGTARRRARQLPRRARLGTHERGSGAHAAPGGRARAFSGTCEATSPRDVGGWRTH